MTRIGFGTRTAGVLAAGALFVCGCGQPPDAGTVNMTAIKAEASRRGIPEAKGPGVARAGGDKSSGRARKPAPTTPLPRGGR